MYESNFAGLREYARTVVRQPDFAAVQRRARRVRRRHAVASGAVTLIFALLVSGVAYAAGLGGNGGGPVAGATPSAGADTEGGWPRVTNAVATGSGSVYAVYQRCRECDPQLYASVDVGATWQPRSLPPAEGAPNAAGRMGELVSLGAATLAWRDVAIATFEPGKGFVPWSASRPKLWITVDGARTWRTAVVDSDPVAAVPAGTRPVGCVLLGRDSPCRVYAVDPDTGRLAPLAHQPTGISVDVQWAATVDVPIGGRLWVPGVEPATRKPVVAASPDGGRTWRTHVFTDGVPADRPDGPDAVVVQPAVAAGTEGVAYALITVGVDRLRPYHTTDGGATWQPVPGDVWSEDAGFVTADGAHIIKGYGRFQASRDGRPYEPVTLPGYPSNLLDTYAITSRPAADRYLSFAVSHLYLSDDGWAWRRVDIP
jgi:hypothetical protein